MVPTRLAQIWGKWSGGPGSSRGVNQSKALPRWLCTYCLVNRNLACGRPSKSTTWHFNQLLRCTDRQNGPFVAILFLGCGKNVLNSQLIKGKKIPQMQEMPFSFCFSIQENCSNDSLKFQAWIPGVISGRFFQLWKFPQGRCDLGSQNFNMISP